MKKRPCDSGDLGSCFPEERQPKRLRRHALCGFKTPLRISATGGVACCRWISPTSPPIRATAGGVARPTPRRATHQRRLRPTVINWWTVAT